MYIQNYPCHDHPPFMYNHQSGALPSHTVSWKRERVSSNHALHPSSRLRARASNHPTSINASQAEAENGFIKWGPTGGLRRCCERKVGVLFFGDCEMQVDANHVMQHAGTWSSMLRSSMSGNYSCIQNAWTSRKPKTPGMQIELMFGVVLLMLVLGIEVSWGPH